MACMGHAVEIEGLTKSFLDRRVLAVPALTIGPGEMVALIGASGSGKSTLLRHIAGLAVADRASGALRVDGALVQQDGRLASGVRRVRAGVGMVFQQFNLVGRLPVLTNVLVGGLHRLPLWRTMTGMFPRVARLAAMEALTRVGVPELAGQRASTLSGGQQQRVAIARTLMQGARLVLADEPIASLDPESSRRVMETLQNLNRQDGITVIVSLHQVDVAVNFCQRIIALRQGEIVFDGPPASLSPALLTVIYGSGLPQTEAAPRAHAFA